MEDPKLNKIPMPPTKEELFIPIDFWSKILTSLDQKVQAVAFNYGWGKVNMTLVVQGGKISQVIFNDEIRISGLDKYLGKPGVSTENKTEIRP